MDRSLNQIAARTNGGFDCEFVKKPKELQSECSVCLLVLREPRQTSCCGYSFCQICIERIQATTINPVCPLCKIEFDTYPNKWLKRELNQLDVYCTHRKEGCEWVGPLGQLDEHLNSDAGMDNLINGCGFVPLKCHACNESVPRRGLRVHLSDLCVQRPFRCEHCGEYNSKYLDVINHHWPQCPCYPVECVNKCGAYPKRKDLQQHISNECLLTNIPCEFCSVPVLRREMHEHLVSNLTTHVPLMVDDKFNRLHQQVDEADEKVRELRQENQYLQDDVEKLRLQVGKNKEEIHRLREDNLETQSLYSEMRQQNDEFMKNYDDLREDYEGLQVVYCDLRVDHDNLREDYEDLKRENDQLQNKVQQLSKDIELAKRERKSRADDLLHQTAAKIKHGTCRNLPDFDEYYESNTSHSDSDSSQASGAKYHPMPFSKRQDEQSSIPPITLKMSDYSSYESGSLGRYWESKPFYSDRQPSYKLCLSVRARSGNLSVYVRLMHGDYDDQLDWPFNADITVQLVNRGARGGRDWERKILFRDGRRVTKRDTAGEAKGGSNFFRLHENSPFIKNNTLWFKVVSVKLVSRKEYLSWR